MGDFFHSLPVPEFREWIFFIPFPFPNFGNGFFHSLPVPKFREWIFFIPFPFPNFGNGFFQFPSRSRILKSHSRSPLDAWSRGQLAIGNCLALSGERIDAEFCRIFHLVDQYF